MEIERRALELPREERAHLARALLSSIEHGGDVEFSSHDPQVRSPGPEYANAADAGVTSVLPRTPSRYRIALRKDEEGFSVCVPGLPGCWSQGATEAEAIENIREAIRDYLQVVDTQLREDDVREIEVAV